MLPTEQVALPFTLAATRFSSAGETHVPVPAAYDFLLTNIAVAATPQQNGSLLIGLESGLYVVGVSVGATASPYVAACPIWEGLFVCPAGSTLYVQSAGFDISASLSGWLLNPPASQILPT